MPREDDIVAKPGIDRIITAAGVKNVIAVAGIDGVAGVAGPYLIIAGTGRYQRGEVAIDRDAIFSFKCLDDDLFDRAGRNLERFAIDERASAVKRDAIVASRAVDKESSAAIH